MSAYMPIFEAIAWVGSQGPELFREVDARRQAEIDAGIKVEGPIVGWLILDRILIDRHGRDYDSVAADIFALAELGEVPSIGRRLGNTYIDIPKLAYVGAKLAGGIDGFRPKDSAIIDLFDENWRDVQFLRTAIEKRWPSREASPANNPDDEQRPCRTGRPEKRRRALEIFADRARSGKIIRSKSDEARKISDGWGGADPAKDKTIVGYISDFHKKGVWDQAGRLKNGAEIAALIECHKGEK